MLIQKISPVGIDVEIQALQKMLYDKLTVLWSIPLGKYISYPRCYRNKKEKGYVAENYISENEYEEVYWNDNIWVNSFFGISGKDKYNLATTTDVHLVFFANISALKPLITHRADEEVRLDVENIVKKNSFSFIYTGMDIWLENVLREYPGTYRDERLIAVDMNPIHCFRLNFSVNYDKRNGCK